MTAFATTIRNSFGLVGGGPASIWGAVTWNAFVWGSSFDILTTIGHLIGNAITPTQAFVQDVAHVLGINTITLSETVSRGSEKVFSNAIYPISNPDETLYDGAGYAYVWSSDTIYGDSRDFPSYTSGTVPSNTWVSASVGSTIWS